MSHGTLTGYYGEGCRCTDCKDVARKYRAKRRAKIVEWEKSAAGRQSHRKYERSEKGRASRHRRKTSEAGKERSRAWAQTPAGKASRRETTRRYAASEKGKAATARHQQTPGWREGLLRNKQRRRARERGVEINERIDRALVYERDGGICQECFAALTADGWEMDHIRPLGPGSHSWTNVQVLCRPCNRKKISSDRRELKEWREVMPWEPCSKPMQIL